MREIGSFRRANPDQWSATINPSPRWSVGSADSVAARYDASATNTLDAGRQGNNMVPIGKA
jgi:hypothetical protein